jgi:signal recognition particle receptor subunit alpha
MIELFTILTSGGIVLFRKSPLSSNLPASSTYLIDQVISNIFIQDRLNELNYVKDGYTIKWTFANDLDLIFVAMYQTILELTWVNDFLAEIKKIFLKKYSDILKNGTLTDIITKFQDGLRPFEKWFDDKIKSYETLQVSCL